MTDPLAPDAPATPDLAPIPAPGPATALPPSSIRPVNCPNCGGTVRIRVQGTTVSVVCEHCGSTLDATSPDLQVIGRADAALKTPQIPLGTRAVLKGKTWEVVGYVERTDGEIGWAEYLLFNPYEGYAFLVDDGRRFSLGRVLDRLPGSNGFALAAEGLDFTRFGDPYPVKVTFVVGEFYWRVAVGETVEETDYVRPGTMLACEDYDGERTWTRLDMFDWGEAEAAFGIAKRRREYSTPAPHEPSPYRSRLTESWIIGIIAAITLMVVSSMGAGQTQVATANADVVLDGAEKTLVLRDVNLAGARNRVSVVAEAPGLDNAWVDIDYSLTDPRTQDSVDAYGLAEYYEGSDSDGRWTEGNPRPDVTMSSIPGGLYDLVVTLQAHKWNGSSSSTSSSSFPNGIFGTGFGSDGGGQTIPVTVSVRSGGISGGNILLGLLLILVWPLITLAQQLGFEKRRRNLSLSGDDD